MTRIVAFGLPYVVVVAMLYLLGFWVPLGLNPFEYIGLEQVALRTATPLVALLVSILVGAAISQLLVGSSMPPGGGADTPIGRFGRKYWYLLVSLHLLLAVLAIFVIPEPWRWYIAAFILAPLGIALAQLTFIIELVPNPAFRGFLMVQLLVIPSIAFAQGRFQAHFVWRDSGRPVVDTVRSNLPIRHSAGHPVIYLGRLGEYLVFGETETKSLVLTRYESVASLYLVAK